MTEKTSAQTEEREFVGIRMKASTNPQGGKCFIGYVRTGVVGEKDTIVICDAERTGMTEEGKYHLQCIPMKGKKGFVVTRFFPAYETASVRINYTEKSVRLFVNDVQGYLFKWSEEKNRLKRTELTWREGEPYQGNAKKFREFVSIKIDNMYLVSDSYRETLRAKLFAEIDKAVEQIQYDTRMKHYRATQTPFDKLKNL